MRTLLTIHGQLHLKADVDHLYVPRKQGGRGLKQLEEAGVVEITKLVECLDKGRSTNTDCHKATTQHQLSNDASRQKYRKEQDKYGSA